MVRKRRYELAPKQLRKMERSIGGIARDLGYQHRANFIRTSKRAASMLPQAFQRIMNK
jgi:methylphosphotriester-DNA--protein-cysteine methyltransferase